MNGILKEKLLLFRITVKKDPEAFGKVYDEYVNRIYRFIYFKVSSAPEAEDLTSEVFLRAWQYLQEGKSVKQLSAFLYKIGRNLVVDHYRNKMLSVSTSEPEVAVLLTDKGKTIKKLETNQEYGALLAAMSKMKEEYREVVHLKYIDELDTGEIAEILGKSTGNVRVILHRASNTLKELLNKK